MELAAKLLNYFLRSNKSNINQYEDTHTQKKEVERPLKKRERRKGSKKRRGGSGKKERKEKEKYQKENEKTRKKRGKIVGKWGGEQREKKCKREGDGFRGLQERGY